MKLTGTLVFSSGRGVDFDIWSLSLESRELLQLTHGSDLNDSPKWSPDGEKIAFISTGADMIPSLHVMDCAGAHRERLTEKVFCQSPCWTPCGKKIVFTANAENPDEIEVCVYNLETKSCEVLFRREGTEREPCVSPDGKKILFSSTNPDEDQRYSNPNTEIWEYDIESGEEKRLTSHSSLDYSPVYSPDGSKIAFVSHRNGQTEQEYLTKLRDIQSKIEEGDLASIDNAIKEVQALTQDSEICIMDADGQNVRQLTDNQGADVGVAWSPCGRFLVYSSSAAGKGQSERLKFIHAETGDQFDFDYDRSALKSEIGSSDRDLLNKTFLQVLMPDFIERQFADRSIWGEERRPDWKG